MGNPVVDEQGDVWVGDEVIGFLGGRVGCHYYRRRAAVWRGGEVGVVHEGDMGEVVGACCEMKLPVIVSWD